MRALLVALHVALAGAASAQQSNCTAQWSRVSELLSKNSSFNAPPPAVIRETADGGCRTNGLTFPVDKNMTVSVESLAWRGEGFDRFVKDGLPPTAMAIALNGIRITPRIGDPVFDYLQSIQARGSKIDVVAEIDWSESAKVLELHSLRIDLPQEDFVEFRARVEGVDLTSERSIQMSAGSFAVTSQTLIVRSTRFFQDYMLLPLGAALLNGAGDPPARVEELKSKARKFVDQVPSKVLSPGSKAALKMLVEDLPEPSGLLVINQDADPGLGPARAMSFALGNYSLEDITELWSLFDGVQIKVTYDKL